MEVRIIKGTNQIGGCVTEIKSEQAKIIIDFGEDLDDENTDIKKEPFKLEGLTKGMGDADYDAVFITHSHGDHIGLINEINSQIPVYVSEKSLIIHNISCDFKNESKVTREIITFDLPNNRISSKPIQIKDIKITPYRADHSSYNSCMFLIESGGKKILHTGDFRNHGRTGYLLDKVLKDIKQVDCLITEGTTISNDSKHESITEARLEEKAKEIFDKYDQVFVLQASTNIDRTVSFCRAALRSNKKFVMDLFTKALNDKIDFKIKYDNKKIFIWKPISYSYKPQEFQEKYMQYEKNYGFLPNYVMQVKSSMYKDIKLLKERTHFTKACLVYSMWEGYKEKEGSTKDFVEKVTNELGLSYEYLHTSGHASVETLKYVEDYLKPRITITIHTNENDLSKQIFKNYVAIEDKEIIIV